MNQVTTLSGIRWTTQYVDTLTIHWSTRFVHVECGHGRQVITNHVEHERPCGEFAKHYRLVHSLRIWKWNVPQLFALMVCVFDKFANKRTVGLAPWFDDSLSLEKNISKNALSFEIFCKKKERLRRFLCLSMDRYICMVCGTHKDGNGKAPLVLLWVLRYRYNMHEVSDQYCLRRPMSGEDHTQQQ